MGFGINILSASLFGSGIEMDAYVIAQTIPFYVSLAIIGGLGYTLIPMIIEKKNVNEQLAWDTANPILSIYLLIIFVSIILGLISIKITLNTFFTELPKETLDLAIQLSYIIWPATFFSGLLTMIGFIYQSYERYIYHALTQLIYSSIYFLFIYFGNLKFGIYILAIGFLLSSVLQLIILLRFVFKKYSFKITFTKEVVSMLKLQGPLIIAVIFGQLPRIIDRSIATKLVIGSIAYIAYADKIKGLIGIVIGSGLALTFFPLLIQNLVNKNEVEFRKNISLGMRITMLLVAPIVCFGSFFALPFVSLLFERGAFTNADSLAVASIMPFFLISLIGATLGNVSSKAIYALKKTNIIASVDIVSTILYIIYAPKLGHEYGLIGIGVAIVILWNSSFMVHCLYLWFILNKPSVLNFIKSMCLIFFIAFLSSYLSYLFYDKYLNQGFISLIFISISGLIFYSLLLYSLKIKEFIKLIYLLKKYITK